MEVTGVTKQLDAMMDAMKKGFATGAKADTTEKGKQLSAEFDATMTKFMSYKEDMLKDFAVLYAETFTAEEMKTVADFYRSGTGAKFITLTPTLMQKGSRHRHEVQPESHRRHEGRCKVSCGTEVTTSGKASQNMLVRKCWPRHDAV